MGRLLALVVLLPACTSNNVTADQACTDYATAICNKIDQCAHGLVVSGWGDAATCAAREKLGCTLGLTATATTLTPQLTDGCGLAIVTSTCDVLYQRQSIAACVAAPGPAVNGAACIENGQCQSQLCRRPANEVCGTCGPESAAGGTCSRDEDCASGMKCVNTTCATLTALGVACDTTHPCAAPNACVGAICIATGGAAAACDDMHPCNFAALLYCHPVTRMCTAIDFAGSGMPCGVVNGGFTICTAGAICATTAGGNSGTCTAVAADGANCNATTGPTCQAPAECVNGVCKLPDPASCL